ncbi:MAG TPA: GspMb/PilO family protein [Chthoniobacteraceae bacterium]|jgi:hypothetical protein|nr:GspMb/PilO family protein [Chthoniobacteraceae bacterium]
MKMSPRERKLAIAMGAIVLVFANLLLMAAFSRKSAALRADLADRRATWANMQDLLGEEGMWAARDAAIDVKQPRLANESAAGVDLLNVVRVMARQHNVTLENEVFGGLEKSQWYRSVPVMMDTHSSWPDLVAFLYQLQKPDQFMVCESVNISVDPSDQTKMLGHFKIARWYAP